MPKIAISYRRADSEAMTGRIFDRLIAHYGKEAIFRDIDDIPPGIDFRVHINQTLLKTHILLAIVGPQWLGMASDGGADRIQEESDPVRVEVETALRRRVPLIPVLIGATRDAGLRPVAAELERLCVPQCREGRYRPGLRLPHGSSDPLHGCDPRAGAEVAAEPRNQNSDGADHSAEAEHGRAQAAAAAAAAEAPRKKDTGSRAAAPPPRPRAAKA